MHKEELEDLARVDFTQKVLETSTKLPGGQNNPEVCCWGELPVTQPALAV